MTLTELRYVVAVARERHFGRAAKACFVSQPTLSVAIKKLEGELEVTLFERRNQGVYLTPAGEQIVRQARRVLEEAEALKRLAAANLDQLHGPLRVGFIHTIGPYLLPSLIPELRERAPHMPLVIEEGMTEELRERLTEGALDLAFLSLPFKEPGLRTQAVYREPFVVLVPSSHPWVQRDSVRAADLTTENLLLLGRGHCFRDQVLALCPERTGADNENSEDHFTIGGGSLETIRHMVVSGMGISVAPTTAAGADRYSQRLMTIKRFVAPVPARTVALAWRESFTRPKAIECVLEAVRVSAPSGVEIVSSSDSDGSLNSSA